MTIVKKISALFLALLPLVSYAECNETDILADDINKEIGELVTDEINKEIENLVTDSRIKTYIYNPNEVYLLVLHHGFQSNIEFAKGEKVQTISLGETYSWKITPLNNLLFIRPLEKNIRTNMTIITNKNQYQFDLIARDSEDVDDSELIYSVKFYYPKKLRKNGQR